MKEIPMKSRLIAVIAVLSLTAPQVLAEEPAFEPGPVFENFGPAVAVEADFDIPDGARFQVSFDVSAKAKEGELNRTLVAAARFMNMHARAGVPVENLSLAVVVHGGATKDVTNAGYYSEAIGGENANAELIAALIDADVEIIVCGQSAAYSGIANDDLLPGVKMALSAMTAHAVLQSKGYTLNPF
jgi:intracellular sulfur oxidation DsrE/DsrF family protein